MTKRRGVAEAEGQPRGAIAGRVFDTTLRVFMTVFLAFIGTAALIVTLIEYGEWRSAQTHLSSSPSGGFVAAMVIAGIVCLGAFAGSFYVFSEWREDDVDLGGDIPEAEMPPPGWYSDSAGERRWWDGGKWTDIRDEPHQ